ncbi:MAG: energy transducer TonB, partial [Lentimicrobiaceae bacterium]|nr:energy transducer TonB [Lentimicrobiaceae bacterium]
MELKKSVKADLERKKSMFFRVGLLVSLLSVFLALELAGTSDKETVFEDMVMVIPDDDQIIQTEEQRPEELRPEQIETSVIAIVENTAEVPDFEISAEVGETEIVQEVAYVEHIERGVIVEEEIFEIVEEVPEFPNGEAARQEFLRVNTVYPRAARETRIEGTVMVAFVVEANGSITNVKVIRSVADILDNEAVRVTKLMPNWK